MEAFEIGDKAYYPVRGVAEVVAMEQRAIGENSMDFYILEVVESGDKIMVPKQNAEAVGLRELISHDDVGEIYEILRSKDGGTDTQTWNRRQREYMDKIRTGSAFEIAEVLRDLCLLRNKKDLSFGERKMLDTARALLVKEIAHSLERKEAEIGDEVDAIFLQAA